MGVGSEIRDPEKTYPISRGQKGHRIPDPQHCLPKSSVKLAASSIFSVPSSSSLSAAYAHFCSLSSSWSAATNDTWSTGCCTHAAHAVHRTPTSGERGNKDDDDGSRRWMRRQERWRTNNNWPYRSMRREPRSVELNESLCI